MKTILLFSNTKPCIRVRHARQQIPPVRRLVNKDPLVRIKMLPHPPAITDCSTRSGLRQAASEEKCRILISHVTQGIANVVNYNYLDDTDIKQSVEEGVVVYEHNV